MNLQTQKGVMVITDGRTNVSDSTNIINQTVANLIELGYTVQSTYTCSVNHYRRVQIFSKNTIKTMKADYMLAKHSTTFFQG